MAHDDRGLDDMIASLNQLVPGLVIDGSAVEVDTRLRAASAARLESEIVGAVPRRPQRHFSGPIKDELARMGIAVDDPTWVNTVLDAPENREPMLLARLLADRGDSLAWAGLLTLESGIGPAFFGSIYDRAVAANASFAEALLAAHAEGFPDAPAASRTRATAAVQQALDWLERQELPEEAPDTGWGAWIVDALRGDPTAEMSDELAGILTGVDEVVEPRVGLGRYLGQVQPLARDQAAAQAGGVRS